MFNLDQFYEAVYIQYMHVHEQKSISQIKNICIQNYSKFLNSKISP